MTVLLYMRRSTVARYALSAAIGFALSSAHPIGIAAAVAMPALALRQGTRRNSYAAALCYYGAALWPLIPGANNFFGPQVSPLIAIALWVFAAAALASPWPLVWTPYSSGVNPTTRPIQLLWRAPAGLCMSIIPPLGIIGWASPLTAAGFLFPGTAWCGLVACALASGAIAAWPRHALVLTAAIVFVANRVHPTDPEPLLGWEGINTRFGAIAHEAVSPMAEYQAAERIQQIALSSTATVIVFPETVVPTWTAATDMFWQPTLDSLRASGKTILIGSRVPLSSAQPTGPIFDFSADLAALSAREANRNAARPLPVATRKPQPPFTYDNALLIRGVEQNMCSQRIAVPVAMWNPFSKSTTRLDLVSPALVRIHGQRAAFLICYEQLLVWPILTSMIHRPTILIAVANDHWAANTTIPQFQIVAVRAWARLFGLPYVSAVNI